MITHKTHSLNQSFLFYLSFQFILRNMPRKPNPNRSPDYVPRNTCSRACGICKKATLCLIPEFWYERLNLNPKGLCWTCASEHFIASGKEIEILNGKMLKSRGIEIPSWRNYVGVIHWAMGMKGNYYLVKDGKVLVR